MAVAEHKTLSQRETLDTLESKFRELYGFTPTQEQMEVLKNDDCAAVFLELTRQQSKTGIQEKFDWTTKRIDRAIRKLKGGGLIEGKGEYWQWASNLEQLEELRSRLLNSLDEAMTVDDWIEPFQTDWNSSLISNAIALLAQEELIQYDQETGKYQRLAKPQPKESFFNKESEFDTNSPTLRDIRIDGGTQPRTELNEDVIAEYAQLLQEGAEFPAITVYFDGVNYWLADGFHRYWAAKRANAELSINVIHGSNRDAILHSVGTNAKHGLRRSNQDKRKAVTTLLLDQEWCQWSDRAIARQCQVSDRLVNKIRQELSTDHSICEYSQMETNHTRKVKRGDQVYEQRQTPRKPTTETAEPQPPTLDPPSHKSNQSVIPEVHPDVHEAICRFLDLEVEAQANQFYQSDDRAYLIASDHPNEFDLMFERLFAQIEGKKLQSAIAVTPNQAGPQNHIKAKANAVCLVSNSQCLCHRAVWYFGQQRHRFYSMFEPFGMTFVFSERNNGEQSNDTRR